MDKLSEAEEMYDVLVENSDENWLLGLLAFAIIEEQRIEWLKHQAINNKNKPTPSEVQNWYEQQPEGVLLRAKDTAEARLKDYSNQIVELVLDDQRKDIEQSIIVKEIQEIKKFWPQFGVNLAGGFVSALLFATLLTIVAFFVINDTTPVKIGTMLHKNVEVSENGTERSN